jgi:mitochondrial fission process protein 1
MTDTNKHNEDDNNQNIFGGGAVGVARAAQYFKPSVIYHFTRPLAYSNEVAESIRKHVPKLVKPLYGITAAYIIGDTCYKTMQAKPENRIIKASDTILWHSMASFVLPTVTVHQTVHWSEVFMKTRNFSHHNIKRVPVILGLLSIPLIIKPIDHFTDYVMDNTFRKIFPDETI